MTARKHLIAIALGACLLGLSAPGSQKNPVARPFKGSGEAIGILSLDPSGTTVYEAFGEGNFTHLGRTTLHAVGYIDEFGMLVAQVTMTAADGDQLIYAAAGSPSGEFEIPFTGGTGRFAGARGSHTEEAEAVFTPGPDGTTVVFITAYYEGTLIY